MGSLPLNIPVEIEMILEVESGARPAGLTAASRPRKAKKGRRARP
jgi:hypothetical protein